MDGGGVQIISRRMVRPEYQKREPETTVHLTPWDLQRITVDYAQRGVVLPKPPPGVLQHLSSSFARALGRFYPLAGRLTVSDGPGLTISLRCSDQGAEFVHAVAPGVTIADITSTLCIPRVVWSLFPLNGVVGTDAAVDPSLPVLAAQVTELADGLVVAMSLNHAAADGTTFWDVFNTWSEISRNGDTSLSTSTLPLPPPKRWFLEGCTVPIPLPFAKVEDMARKPEYPPVKECSLHFSTESVRKLKAKANNEMSAGTGATISSLQAVLAHLWQATCRARGLAQDQETTCSLAVGCRAHLKGMPQVYVGNAVTGAVGRAAVGEILGDGRLGWAALLLNRAVAAVDEASVREELAAWPGNPSFKYLAGGGAAIMATGSPRFDVYGNDFGWGRPVAVRSGPANKVDGMVTVYGDGGGSGGLELQVCLAPDVLDRLVADEELLTSYGTPV
ncbi:unnamed protein product [Triticum aestivum]|uniref:Uncharacterized protein n=1 Tax=Triticum aestivum TaxID=4565 RepID=A0A7H4LQZ5_WHEAT|nr:unnamed protein product [Triticum aestivum]